MSENSRCSPVFLLLGCLVTSSCGDSRPPSFVSGPRVSPNPNPAVPLAAILEFSTDEQVWFYGGPGAFFSSFVSEADLLPVTGNVLVTVGGLTRNDQGEYTSGREATRYSTRIVEVTHSQSPEIVFELLIEDPSVEDPMGWTVYRSERLPDRYPD